MKNGLSVILIAGCAVALLQLAMASENKPATAPPSQVNTAPPGPKPYKPVLKNEKEDMSYAIGMSIGRNLIRSPVAVDVDVLIQALKDAQAGRTLRLTDAQMQESNRAYQIEARTEMEEARVRVAERNRKVGEAFLEENKKKDGVKTHTVTLPGGKTAEMQYKVITEGTGAIPKRNDVVRVNYRGTLINGTEFDSSAKRGQPARFPVTRVIRGWTEALEMMKAGSKWELYLPSTLAYGDRAFGKDIEPGSTLIFEVELLGIENPKPPAPALAQHQSPKRVN